MDTTEKEVLHSKFSMMPIPAGKATSKIYKTTENARNILTFGSDGCFFSYTEYTDN